MSKMIINLRNQDFNSEGILKHPFYKDKKMLLLIHAEYCHFCTLAVPEFIKAATILKDKPIWFCMLQMDGKVPGEKEFVNILKNKISVNFAGVPEYVFFTNGKPTVIEIDNRNADFLVKKINDFCGF
nr:MAG: thioredoxin-like protein [Diabrotica toursvirus 3a]UOX61078.1 MAG: thioredoxin-like protein [Diabrotica toursvirus 3a]